MVACERLSDYCRGSAQRVVYVKEEINRVANQIFGLAVAAGLVVVAAFVAPVFTVLYKLAVSVLAGGAIIHIMLLLDALDPPIDTAAPPAGTGRPHPEDDDSYEPKGGISVDADTLSRHSMAFSDAGTKLNDYMTGLSAELSTMERALGTGDRAQSLREAHRKGLDFVRTLARTLSSSLKTIAHTLGDNAERYRRADEQARDEVRSLERAARPAGR